MSASALVSSTTIKEGSTKQNGIHQIARLDVGALLIILLIGGFLRFVHLEVIDWSNDHSDIALLAQNLAYGEGLPLLGQPSSAVVPFSPFFVYPSILPFSVTDNPILASAVSAFLNLIGIVVIWLIGLRYFGRTAAIVAGFAYAVNPWVLGYSRSIWSGDHRAVFVSLGVLLGLLGFYEGKRWAQVLCLPVLLIGIQVHYAAYTLLPLYLLLFWIGRKKTNWKVMSLSFALAMMVLLPYIVGIFLMFANQTLPISNIRPQPREFSLREIIKPYGHMFWLATGTGTELYSARENAAELRGQALVPTALWVVEGAAVFLGLIGLWRFYPRKIAGVLSLWALLTLFAFTLPLIGVYPHYFIPVIPALSLLTGIGVAWMVKAANRFSTMLGVGVGGVYGVVFLSQAMFWLASLTYLDTHFTPSQFGFGTPIHYLMDVRSELQQQRNIVFVTSSDWVDFSRTGSRLFAPFLRNTADCLRDIKVGSRYAVIPEGSFATVFAPRAPSDEILDDLYRSENSTTVPLRSGEGVYVINRINDTLDWRASSITPIQPITFSNNVQLTGYSLDTGRLVLRWALPPQIVQDASTYSVQFFDAEDRLLSEGEAEFWPGRNWCEGDQLFTWMDIDGSEQPSMLQITFAPSRSELSLAESGVSTGPNDAKAVIQLREQ